MTDPTQDAAPERPPWRLTLEHGDRLEVRSPEKTDSGSSEPQVVLTMRPYRAAERGRAMVVLQQARPELTHDQLVAVVDATAWWLDGDQDFKATDLLDSVTSTEVSGEIYMTLLDWKPPTPPTPGD